MHDNNCSGVQQWYLSSGAVIMLQNFILQHIVLHLGFSRLVFFLFSSVLAYIFGTNGQNLTKFQIQNGLQLRKQVSENEGHRSKVKVTGHERCRFFLFSSVLAYIFGTNGRNLIKFEIYDGLLLRIHVLENEGHKSKVKVTRHESLIFGSYFGLYLNK